MNSERDQSYDRSVPERLVDAYFPDGPIGRALVWFHGGGLETGDRRVGADFAEFCTGRGCALISVEYRLAPKVRHPLWLEDGAAAIRWTLGRLAHLGAGSVPLFLSGHSAGGWVAAMLGLDARWLAAEGIALDRIAGIIPISGQMTTHHRIRQDRGVVGTIRPLIDDAAPLYHAAADSVPFLSITGGNDIALRSSENRYMDEVLAAHGHADHAFHEIPGRDHNTVAAGLASADDVVTQLMWAFMDRVGLRSCQSPLPARVC